jgi:hypothetical protein
MHRIVAPRMEAAPHCSMLRFGESPKRDGQALVQVECVDGKILARHDQIAIHGRGFRFDLPLI